MAKISLVQFTLMNREDRAQQVWEHGPFLLCIKGRQEAGRSLYALGNFWVELAYDNVNNRLVDVFPCFTMAQRARAKPE